MNNLERIAAFGGQVSVRASKMRKSLQFFPLVLFRSTGAFAGQATTRPFALFKSRNCLAQVSRCEIRPAFFHEEKFGTSPFPKQKLRKTLFPSCADHQIDVGRAAALYFRKTIPKGFRGKIGR